MNKHTIDTGNLNLMECPWAESDWTWGEGVPPEGGIPPFCPACGQPVSAWLVKVEGGEVIKVQAAKPRFKLEVAADRSVV